MLFFLALLSGVYLGGHSYRLSPLVGILPESVRTFFFPGDNVMQLEQQIEGILDQSYYQPVDNSSLETNAINGMVASLNDPYTVYLDPRAFKAFNDHTQGTFVGIGVTLEPKNGQLVVISVIAQSPAQQADIRAGDVILAVGGQPVAGKAPDDAAAMVRGAAGTPVTLRLRRGTQELDKSVVRQSLEMPIVTDKMLDHDGKKIAYIKLEQFSVDAGAKVRASLDNLVKGGAQGVILDLRDNGGGLLDEAVNVGSVFIPNGTIVSVGSRDSGTQTYNARGDANASIPLVLLVNGNTASASEIVAGAVKDDHRGTLIGEKTFGKGVVQDLAPLSNGGALKYTSGSYYTPSGANINKIGIQPDIPATDDPNTPNDEVIDRGLALLAP
ncbi:MAG: S41 family peptidase [Thermoleophilia bacterium]